MSLVIALLVVLLPSPPRLAAEGDNGQKHEHKKVKLAELADLVVIGAAEQGAYRTDPPTATRSYPETIFTLRVDSVAKGKAPKTVDLRVPGGDVGKGLWVSLSHQPEVVFNELAAFFLEEQADGSYRTVMEADGLVPRLLWRGGQFIPNPAYSDDPTAIEVDESHFHDDDVCNNQTGFSGFVGSRNVNGNPIRWDPAQFSTWTFAYEAVDMADWVAGLDWAANDWNAVGLGGFALARGAPYPGESDSPDGHNVVSWGSPSRSSALAEARVYTFADGRAGEADVIFNSSKRGEFLLAGDVSADFYDFVSVAQHEFGHVLGLNHVLDSYGQLMTMFCGLAKGATKRTPRWGDQAGARNRYPLNDTGYYMSEENGAVYGMGGLESWNHLNAPYYGGANINNVLGYPTRRIVDIEVNRANTAGYWQLSDNGGIYGWGSAQYKGSVTQFCGNCPVAGMASTPSGNGYWLVGTDGGVFAFGDAQFYGSGHGVISSGSYATGIAARPDGRGYWIVNNKGEIYAFGSAPYAGGLTSAQAQSWPVRGIESSITGNGYWLLGNDGGIFAFGDAPFLGAAAPGAPGVRNLSRHPYENQYQWINNEGGIFMSTNGVWYGRGTGSTTWAVTAITKRPGSSGTTPSTPPDFTIAAAPSTLMVPRGGSNSSTITLAANSTFYGNVGLFASGVPGGVSTSFSPGSVSLGPNSTGTSVLTVNIGLTYLGGQFTMTVTGCGGGLCRSTPVTVQPAPL